MLSDWQMTGALYPECRYPESRLKQCYKNFASNQPLLGIGDQITEPDPLHQGHLSLATHSCTCMLLSGHLLHQVISSQAISSETKDGMHGYPIMSLQGTWIPMHHSSW